MIQGSVCEKCYIKATMQTRSKRVSLFNSEGVVALSADLALSHNNSHKISAMHTNASRCQD